MHYIHSSSIANASKCNPPNPPSKLHPKSQDIRKTVKEGVKESGWVEIEVDLSLSIFQLLRS